MSLGFSLNLQIFLLFQGIVISFNNMLKFILFLNSFDLIHQIVLLHPLSFQVILITKIQTFLPLDFLVNLIELIREFFDNLLPGSQIILPFLLKLNPTFILLVLIIRISCSIVNSLNDRINYINR